MNAKEIQTIDETPGTAVAPTSESAAVLDMISRAASNPDYDVDKMERLLTMRQTMIDREAKLEFDRAMKSAQSEMSPVRANLENNQTRSKYASYAALDAVVRPIYTKHGFSVGFNTGDAQEGMVRVLCEISHDLGFTKHLSVDMPADGKGAKGGDVMTKTHATGSALSYGQRYLLKLGFNLSVAGDDDGNAADGPMVLNSSQAKLFINFDLIAKTIREMPTFKRLENMRAFIETITFVHPSTVGIWLEECDARAEAMNAAQEAAAKQKLTGKEPESETDYKQILWEFSQQTKGLDAAGVSEVASEYESLLEGAPSEVWDHFTNIVKFGE